MFLHAAFVPRSTTMPTYDCSDCVAAVQLAAWMTGKEEKELTVSLYRSVGMKPSVRTVIERFDGWDAAKVEAANSPQQIPSHLSQYYRSVAALRRVRDLDGHPVTGFKFKDRDEMGVTYLEALEPFPTWTQAKIVARVHSPGDDPWDGIEPITTPE